MPEYWYKALTANGTIDEGWVTAEDESAIERQLRAIGSYLVTADLRGPTVTAAPPSVARPAGTDGGIDRKEMLAFLEYLAASIEAGIPILTTLDDVGPRLGSARFRKILGEIRYAVADEGKSLSEAMSEHPTAFPPLFVSTIHAGETTGQLAFTLRQLIEYMDWVHGISAQIREATTYPIIVILAISLLVTGLIGFVFPRILPVLHMRSIELPLPTRIIMATSDFVRHQGGWIAAVLVVLALGVWLVRRTEVGRYRIDDFVLHLPVVGPLVRDINVGRFVTYLGLFYRTGVELVLALSLVEEMVTNRSIAQGIAGARHAITNGETISNAFARTRTIPPIVLRAIALGEATGSLDEALTRAQAYYSREVPASVKRMILGIQPALLILLGGVVLIVGLAIMLPILNIYNSIGR